MSFFDEILYETGFAAPAAGFNIISYNGDIVYAEGIKRVLSFDAAIVKLEAKRAVITLEGDGLTVKKLDEGSAVIAGAIRSIVTEKR